MPFPFLLPSSGAGKSTVAALLERLYPADAGTIACNGVNIAAFSRREWVDAVTTVSQVRRPPATQAPRCALLRGKGRARRRGCAAGPATRAAGPPTRS